MKAIYCPTCHDIVLLKVQRLRTCECGRCKGMYLDDWYAVTNGEGYAMALGTGDFHSGLEDLRNSPEEQNRDHYMNHCKLNYVWFRPQTGKGNPHSSVVENSWFEKGLSSDAELKGE